jgi:hypothetical protein
VTRCKPQDWEHLRPEVSDIADDIFCQLQEPMPNLDGKWTLKLIEIVLQESEQHAVGSCYLLAISGSPREMLIYSQVWIDDLFPILVG